MRKNLKWISIFAIGLVILGYAQYRSENRDPTFEAQLLDFKPQQIQRIDISAPNQPATKILREGNRWLLSYENVHVQADAAAVEELLHILERLTSSQIIATDVEQWETYGLAPEQALQLCLQDQTEALGCLRFGRFSYASDQQNLRVFVRLNDGKEVYAADGLFLSKLESDPRAYRPNLLWLVQGEVQHLEWQTPDTSYYVFRDSSGWQSPHPALDTVDWTSYLKEVRYLSGSQFADDFNELSGPDLLHWQLRLATFRDTFVLHCYRDTTRELPYIYHTRSRPEQWLADDGHELYPSLAAPWLPALPNTTEDYDVE
jgi:hypothetical protein